MAEEPGKFEYEPIFSGRVSWDGGEPTWYARREFLMFGPRIERVCMTKIGARFAAWRRRRRV